MSEGNAGRDGGANRVDALQRAVSRSAAATRSCWHARAAVEKLLRQCINRDHKVASAKPEGERRYETQWVQWVVSTGQYRCPCSA